MKKCLFALLAIALIAAPAFAQRSSAVATFTLTVTTDVQGAKVFVNDAEVGVTPYTAELAGGDYTLTLKLDGYETYTEAFTLAAAKEIKVNLVAVPAVAAVAPPVVAVETPKTESSADVATPRTEGSEGAVVAVAPPVVKVETPPVAIEVPVVNPLDAFIAEVQSDYVVVKGDTLKAVAADVFGDYRYWPIVYFSNKDTIAFPEVIEPNSSFKIYKLPFNAKAPDAIANALIAELYIQAYEAYLPQGDRYVNARRWVLLQALAYDANLFSTFVARIDFSDAAWYAAR